MTNNLNNTLGMPCGDCLKADVGLDGKPMMCRKVASLAIASLETHHALDVSVDTKPEGIIAAAYLGQNAVVDLAVKSACKYLPKGRPLEQLSVLDRIQC